MFLAVIQARSAIVKPELVDVERDGVVFKAKWPKQPLIVTGSRVNSLRVWALKLPRPGDSVFRCLVQGVQRSILIKYKFV